MKFLVINILISNTIGTYNQISNKNYSTSNKDSNDNPNSMSNKNNSKYSSNNSNSQTSKNNNEYGNDSKNKKSGTVKQSNENNSNSYKTSIPTTNNNNYSESGKYKKSGMVKENNDSGNGYKTDNSNNSNNSNNNDYTKYIKVLPIADSNENNNSYKIKTSDDNNYSYKRPKKIIYITPEDSDNSGNSSDSDDSDESGYYNTPSGSNGTSNGNFDINKMLDLVNQARSKVGAKPLKLNDKLTKAAQSQSDYQNSIKKMTHSGPGGNSVSDRVKQQGYQYSSCGENVAYNQKSVEQVMNSWINSPGHYANIVNKKYTDFGAGMNNYYWTQDFGTGK